MAEPQRRPDASPVAATAHFLIVEGRFYDDINDMLLSGATAALTAAGATFDVVRVPGALEVPTAIAICLQASSVRADAPMRARWRSAASSEVRPIISRSWPTKAPAA